MQGEIGILKRHVIFGTFLTCLLQTSGTTCGVAKEVAASGANLLFSHQNEVSVEPTVSPIEATVAEPITEEVTEAIQEEKPSGEFSQDDPVDLLADRVEYDEQAGIVSAIGNVELVQSGRILRAEKVSYNLKQDKVQAKGNVVLNEVTGETYFADDVELKDKMKDGFVTGLSGILIDGSRFTAAEAEKVQDLKVIMRQASYTPCEPCKKDPSKAPLWQITADKVTHHKDEKRITYEDAKFEVVGTPIAYTPYFSHSDGSVERKSGFLTPDIGFDSDLGTSYQQEYYWNIAPDKDLTVGLALFTEEPPLLSGQYRQRFEDAAIELEGGVTYSSRIDSVNGVDVRQDDEERGHLFAEGLWDINQKWRAGTSVQLVSDEQYLRQYNVSNDDVLENEIFIERFSDRDYSTARFLSFQDVRVSDRNEDQPNILPEIYNRFLGNPNGLLGGRWSAEISGLGLQREGNDQDLSRATLELGWQRRHVSSIGLVSTLDLSSRGDAYHAEDRDVAASTISRSSSSSSLRGFASANLQTSFPVKKDFSKAQLVVEPLASITAGSNLNDDDDIPNEDSQDVFLDATNIFNANRFPGFDRIEDESHTTYGVRTGLYGDNGYQGEVFFGQSYRFDRNDNPFPEGSGLSEQSSDFVGHVSARAGNRLQLNYGFQLENDSFASQRHEVDASTKIGKLSLSSRYFYADALEGTDLDTAREQIQANGRYNFTEEWSVFGGLRYDLARETEGLKAGIIWLGL